MVKSHSPVNAEARQRDNDEHNRKHRKAKIFALIAFIAALMAYLVAVNAQDTADANANITNVFEIVVNNTDLGDTNGTGERLVGTLYYTNISPIAIALIGKVVGTGADTEANIGLNLNGTMVQNTDIETEAGSLSMENGSLYYIIPKNSNYSVEAPANVDFLEWREYPILSGRNGT